MWAEINFRLLCCSALPSKDLHYVAADKGEVVLAAVAKKKANEIDAEAQTSVPGERIIHIMLVIKKCFKISYWCVMISVYKCKMITHKLSLSACFHLLY